jgi:hypothetical protein
VNTNPEFPNGMLKLARKNIDFKYHKKDLQYKFEGPSYFAPVIELPYKTTL